MIGAVGRSEWRAGVCCSFAAESTLRRRETGPEQGVARAFAVDFLQKQQKQQTAGRDGPGAAARAPQIQPDAALFPAVQ